MEAPPALETINFDEIDTYACSKCNSNIKIISIDEKSLNITFECLNEDINNDHRIQTLKISEYIQQMIKNTYFFDKCSNCNVSQNYTKKFTIFKYCIKCNKVFCNQCKDIHLNNNQDHFFINNNEKRIKCLIHSQNNSYTDFCINCNKHLCKECIKTRKHLNHNKNPIEELLLLDENKLNHKKIIELLKKESQKLEEEKENKSNEINIKINEEKKRIENQYKNKNVELEIKFKNDLNIRLGQLQSDLKELKKKYDNDVKLMNSKYEIDKKIIIDNFNKIYEENKKFLAEEINMIINQPKNDDFIKILNQRINGLNNLIKINEILKKTQEENENNFYINLNINKAIESFKNSENKEIRKISLDNIELLKKETPFPIENMFMPKQEQNNSFLSKKIKNENTDQFIFGKAKSEKINLNNIDKNQYFNNKFNFNSKQNINLKEEPEIFNNDVNSPKRNYQNISCDSKHELNIVSSDIISDAYCPLIIDNSFIVFESQTKIPLIVYATEDKSIICYNLKFRKIETKITNAHKEYISNFCYCNNYIIHKELIISISYKDTNLKIWEINDNWKCLLNIKNVYSNGYLYSSSFLNKQNNYYFVTSNWEEAKYADSIRVYDYDGNIIKKINDSEYNAILIKILYNNDDTYILASNEDNIKSYNYNKNELFHKYYDNFCYCKILGFLIFINSKKIYAPCHDKLLRIWDFFSGKLTYKINIEASMMGICFAKEKNIIIGFEKQNLYFLDIKNWKIIKNLKNHKDNICSVKKKFIPEYGSCLFTHGLDKHIFFWNIKE